MGTRHLTAVYLDGECKVAQYGQWDGYPSSTGAHIHGFLKRVDLDAFKEKCRRLNHLSGEEVTKRWESVGADDSGFVSMEIANTFNSKWPCLGWDAGSEVLYYIDRGDTDEVHLREEFAGDGLFCEWAYAIDLDDEKLEIYQGFNCGEGGRYTKLKSVNKDYRPVGLLCSIPISELHDTADAFVAWIDSQAGCNTES